jgi:hypothetical protein
MSITGFIQSAVAKVQKIVSPGPKTAKTMAEYERFRENDLRQSAQLVAQTAGVAAQRAAYEAKKGHRVNLTL